MLNDALPMDDSSTLPTDHRDPVVEIVVPVEQTPANANVPASLLPKPSQVVCNLQVDELDERGNTVKYIYSCDQDYVVYYSRLEHQSVSAEAETKASGAGKLRRRPFRSRRLSVKQASDLPYESEGVQAQLSSDPATRQRLRRLLLPLGTERAKLQALLSDWPRRQSFDSSIATALQLALDGDGNADAKDNALQTLKDAKAAVLTEREIAGKAQYVRFTLILALVGIFLLVLAQHNLFKGSGNFWLGAQAGLFGAVLSIAIGIRRKTVALDIGVAGNLSDGALRLVIGAVSGGTLVLLFATGLLPSLHTLKGEQDAVQTMTFALLLGIIAGFVEQLVPSLLEDQAQKFRNGEEKAPTRAGSTGNKAP
jgi:hypothetical protein